jgi:hypothetical protein
MIVFLHPCKTKMEMTERDKHIRVLGNDVEQKLSLFTNVLSVRTLIKTLNHRPNPCVASV